MNEEEKEIIERIQQDSTFRERSLLRIINKQQAEIEKKDKIIDLMAKDIKEADKFLDSMGYLGEYEGYTIEGIIEEYNQEIEKGE